MSIFFKRLVHLGEEGTSFIHQRIFLPTLTQHHSISSSQIRYIKEIKEEKKDGVTLIEGVKQDSFRKDKVLPSLHENACPLCQLNMDLKYDDVLILSQFLQPDGGLLPRNVTNVCKYQQKKLKVLVKQAQSAGLLNPFKPLTKSGKEPSDRPNYKWKKYNIHFEDD